MSRRRCGTRSSSTNRDRRDQTFARSVIAEAARRNNQTPKSFTNTVILNIADEQPGKICDDCNGTGQVINFNGRPVSEVLHELATLYGTEIEVCPDCFGKGEVNRYVDDTHVSDAVCLECGGAGWVR